MSAAGDFPPCPEFVAACERGDVFQRDPRPLGPDGFTPLAPESVENARRAEQAERRAEDAEAEVERLKETLQQQPFRVAEANRLRAEDAEAAIEATRDLLHGWEHDGPDDYAVRLLVQRVRETLALGERFRTSRKEGER